jgi:hypothetical protein
MGIIIVCRQMILWVGYIAGVDIFLKMGFLRGIEKELGST